MKIKVFKVNVRKQHPCKTATKLSVANWIVGHLAKKYNNFFAIERNDGRILSWSCGSYIHYSVAIAVESETQRLTWFDVTSWKIGTDFEAHAIDTPSKVIFLSPTETINWQYSSILREDYCANSSQYRRKLQIVTPERRRILVDRILKI